MNWGNGRWGNDYYNYVIRYIYIYILYMMLMYSIPPLHHYSKKNLLFEIRLYALDEFAILDFFVKVQHEVAVV